VFPLHVDFLKHGCRYRFRCRMRLSVYRQLHMVPVSSGCPPAYIAVPNFNKRIRRPSKKSFKRKRRTVAVLVLPNSRLTTHPHYAWLRGLYHCNLLALVRIQWQKLLDFRTSRTLSACIMHERLLFPSYLRPTFMVFRYRWQQSQLPHKCVGISTCTLPLRHLEI